MSNVFCCVICPCLCYVYVYIRKHCSLVLFKIIQITDLFMFNEWYQGVSIQTGEEARLAKMKPPMYGHSHLHTKCIVIIISHMIWQNILLWLCHANCEFVLGCRFCSESIYASSGIEIQLESWRFATNVILLSDMKSNCVQLVNNCQHNKLNWMNKLATLLCLHFFYIVIL